MGSLLNRLIAHRHGPFLAALAGALLSGGMAVFLTPAFSAEIAAVTFFIIYLCLICLRLPELTADYLKRHAESADEPAPVIIAVTVLAVTVSVIALFLALNRQGGTGAVELVLAFASVVLGWLTIHTMAAIHYAHLYWRPEATELAERKRHKGGLDFPETPAPCGYDFLYFSFVIGMTAQTSDTAVTTTAMRRLNLLHSVISYFFNTVLVAAAVNAAVSLAG
ncbi:MAG TPA: DUF1345 domain-containing protein [Rhizobium sp.]|nr:DUF1345 domain-containing protein [Rhizobium sp.]